MNYISAVESRQVTTFLTNTCNRGYKQCIQTDTMETCAVLMEECKETKVFRNPGPIKKNEPKKQKPLSFNKKDNQVNLRRCKKKKFYDAAICRHLCSSSLVLKSRRTSPTNSCEEICFELTRSSKTSGEICPYQKYCPSGCPCPLYACEKIGQNEQENIPVWDLESKKSRKKKARSLQPEEMGKEITRVWRPHASTRCPGTCDMLENARNDISTNTKRRKQIGASR